VLNNYAHIFDILIRLRQAADHPWLVQYSNKSAQQSAALALLDGGTADAEGSSQTTTVDVYCPLCEDSVDTTYRVAMCGCAFCFGCVQNALNNAPASGLDCPRCRVPLNVSLTEQASFRLGPAVDASIALENKNRRLLSRIPLDRFRPSTKMEALMEELHNMDERDPGAKAIVFSQFVNMLDLVEHRLKMGGYSSVKLVGGATKDKKDAAIKRFNEDPECKVFLVSLKAGGVALNLTVANYSFIMDPWWNPAAEFQAIDRTHRIGQHRPVHAVRFIIADSIEERILQLQEKKRLVFDGTVGGDASSMVRLTQDDIAFLFH